MTQKNLILTPITSSKEPMAPLIKIKNKYEKRSLSKKKKIDRGVFLLT